MKNLKIIIIFILGIVWLPCALLTLAGFGLLTIRIGDVISGYDSFTEMAIKPCDPMPPSYCMIETSYKIYLQNKIIFFVYVIIGISGLAYIKKKSLFKTFGIKKKN